MILLDLRQETRINCKKSCHLWRRNQSRLMSTISCTLFGRFHYLSTYWSLMVSSAVKGFVLFWTVLGLYCHWKWSFLRRREQEKIFFITPHFSSLRFVTFRSTRHRDIYQVRWSDDSDLWYWSRWRGQSPKRGGTSGNLKEVQKTTVQVVCLSTTACRCLLQRQVLVHPLCQKI